MRRPTWAESPSSGQDWGRSCLQMPTTLESLSLWIWMLMSRPLCWELYFYWSVFNYCQTFIHFYSFGSQKLSFLELSANHCKQYPWFYIFKTMTLFSSFLHYLLTNQCKSISVLKSSLFFCMESNVEISSLLPADR